MPSRSGVIVKRPRPFAARSSTGTLRSNPGKCARKALASGPRVATPVIGKGSSGGGTGAASAVAPRMTRAGRIARRRARRHCSAFEGAARVSPRRDLEAMRQRGRATDDPLRQKRYRSRSPLRRPAVASSRSRRRASAAHGHWPNVREARLIDIEDDDGTLRCLARLQYLERVEDPQSQRFDGPPGR